MVEFFLTILSPIKLLISYILVFIHKGLVYIGLSPGPGVAWVLSIIGLTIVVRLIILPLFNKQIRSQRGMQEIQPEINKIRKKYEGKKDQLSRQRINEETWALYKTHKVNPMASCFPSLIQLPIMMALYQVLHEVNTIASGSQESIGLLTRVTATHINTSQLFGVRLSDSLMTVHTIQDKVVIGILVIILALLSFFSTKQLTMQNMPAVATDNPAASMQKNMMYMMPVFMLVSGVMFQMGVLLYWLTGNIWQAGQQFYVIQNMPNPGSPAYIERIKKVQKKYDLFRKVTMEEYATKIDQASGQTEKITELESERDGKLKKKRLKLGLEKPVKNKSLVEEETPKGQRIQPIKRKRNSRGKVSPSENENSADLMDSIDSIGSEYEIENNADLTKEEIAQKRYKRRAAERKRATQRRIAKENQAKNNKIGKSDKRIGEF